MKLTKYTVYSVCAYQEIYRGRRHQETRRSKTHDTHGEHHCCCRRQVISHQASSTGKDSCCARSQKKGPGHCQDSGGSGKENRHTSFRGQEITPVKKAAHEPAPFTAKDNKAGKPAKAKKAKLVRDSFTMPDGEYALIATLKKRCLDAGVSAKKSELLRAAVANLAKLSDTSVVAALRRLEVIKTGRPAKSSK